MVHPWVSHDNDSGLLETLGDVVGKVTGSESAGDRLSAGETRVLQDCAMTVWSSRDDTDVVGVVDGSEDSSCKDELLPSFANVQDVDT